MEGNATIPVASVLGLSSEAWATLAGAILGAMIAALVAWLIQRASAKHARDLLDAQLEHQAKISFYQVEWPWYREVLHHVASVSRGAKHAMDGTNTHDIGRQTQDALAFLHTALDVFTRTNVLAAYAIRDIIHAAFEAMKPGVRTDDEKKKLRKQCDEVPKRLSLILVKSAGIEPSFLVEEMGLGEVPPEPPAD